MTRPPFTGPAARAGLRLGFRAASPLGPIGAVLGALAGLAVGATVDAAVLPAPRPLDRPGPAREIPAQRPRKRVANTAGRPSDAK